MRLIMRNEARFVNGQRRRGVGDELDDLLDGSMYRLDNHTSPATLGSRHGDAKDGSVRVEQIGRRSMSSDDPLQYRKSAVTPIGANSPDPARSSSEDRAPTVLTRDGQTVSLAVGMEVKKPRAEVDVCFVFDTTGSMSDKIQGLTDSMTGFVDELSKLSLDWRTSCVPFGDLTVPGDRIDAELSFVNTADTAKAQLRGLPHFNGGGNEGESSIEAMLAGLHKPWRQSAVRVIVLLTDESALGSHRASDIDRRLTDGEIICFVASISTDYFKAWAARHGGRWMEIGPYMDTSSLLTLLRDMVRDVAKVAHSVHELAGGSVRRYLELEAGGAMPLGAPDQA